MAAVMRKLPGKRNLQQEDGKRRAEKRRKTKLRVKDCRISDPKEGERFLGHLLESEARREGTAPNTSPDPCHPPVARFVGWIRFSETD